MEKREFELIGCVFVEEGSDKRYVTYYADEEFVYAVNMDSSCLDFKRIRLIDLFGASYEILKSQDEVTVVDETTFTEEQLKEYEDRVAFLRDVEQAFGPIFTDVKTRERSSEVNELIQKYGFSPSKGWRLIRRYLQIALNLSAAVDLRTRQKEHKPYEYQKRTGRLSESRAGVVKGVVLTEEHLKHFEEFRRLYLNNKYKKYEEAYGDMCNKYYSRMEGKVLVDLPISECPTFSQFYKYCYTRTKKEELDKKKKGAEEQRNNNRLLPKSVRANVKRPGQVLELDALEADVEIVSEFDETQRLGRAIVYAAVDVYSGAIVAVEAGYNNNSNIGLSCLLLNIIDEKRALLESVGIRLDGEIPWPSNFIPQTVRCDNGSDFTSKQFEEVCGRLKVKIENVPPRMGSLKPMVEHIFHLFQDRYRSHLHGIGLIEKDAVTKRKTLCLTMREFKQMLYTFVLFHNARPNSDYRRSPDMIAKKVGTAPIELWKYGVEEAGTPRKIIGPAQKRQYVYDLMVEDKASMSRQGIRFKGLFYMTDDEDFLNQCYDAGDTRVPIMIRYDPRSVDEVYLERNGQLLAFPLNPDKNNNVKYKGMTWTEYNQYRKAELAMKRKEREERRKLNRAESNIFAGIAKAAKKSRGGNKIKTTDVREAREAEKQADNYNKRLSARPEMKGVVPEQSLPQPEPEEKPDYDYTPYDDPNDMFD